MEDQKKIEFYRYLKELYPNLKDTTIMLLEYKYRKTWSTLLRK